MSVIQESINIQQNRENVTYLNRKKMSGFEITVQILFIESVLKKGGMYTVK